MFTTPCIIGKNTPELREKLENLGYKYSGADGKTLDYIITFPHKALYSIFDKWHIIKQPKVFSKWIPCGADNEELFLALAALRDDSPINSYYWFKDKLVICYNIFDLNINQNITYRFQSVDNPKICFSSNIDIMRKATVEEIIEHFKNR